MGREIVHVGRRIQVAIDTSVSATGVPIRRDVILHPGAVVILPILDDQNIVLLRNYRPVVEETLWEIPAGTLETGEPHESAARRELQEETGYTASHWEYRGFLYASPGVLNEKLHLFFASGLVAGPQQLEADEEIVPITVPRGDAIAMCLDGRIRDAKTITSILLWDRLYPATTSRTSTT
jgi:ADP-ribose pyrophosphatase